MKKVTTTNLSLAYFLLELLLVSCKDRDSPLAGTWKFAADQQVDSIGNVIDQDSNVSGLLIYTPKGDMSIQLLWHQRREPVISDSIMKYDGNSTGVGLGINSWTADQNRIWIDTYDAYFGEYEVDRERNIVTHRIDGNLRPEKRSKEYQRQFEIQGDTLFLRSTNPRDKWRVVWLKKNN